MAVKLVVDLSATHLALHQCAKSAGEYAANVGLDLALGNLLDGVALLVGIEQCV